MFEVHSGKYTLYCILPVIMMVQSKGSIPAIASRSCISK